MPECDELCEQAKLLLDHMAASAALLDREMRYVACSQRWLAEIELGMEEVRGRPHYEIFPDFPADGRAAHRRAVDGETVSHSGEWLRRRGMADRWLRWEMAPWRHDDGKIVGAALFIEDLSELHDGRARDSSSSRQLDLLIGSAVHHALYVTDSKGIVLVWNPGAQRVLGWTSAEIVGRSSDLLYTVDDLANGLPARQRDLALAEGAYHGHSQCLRRDGSALACEVTVTPIREEADTQAGFGVVVHDTTDAERRSHELALHAAHLRSILETVPDAMIVIDEHGIVQSFSSTSETMFGYRAAEVVGSNIAMIMPEADAARHDGYLAAYRSTGQRHIIGNKRRVFGRRKDGATFPLELYVGETFSDGRRLFTGFLHDLTHREESDRQLRELQGELVGISRISAVGTIATALAHDLNQPLAAVVNYVQASAALLAQGDPVHIDLVREGIEEAGREALRAGAIVQHLREFIAQGESSKFVASPDVLAAHACELGTVGFPAGAPSCRLEIPPDLPHVLANPVQIQQVLFNLVHNAARAVGGTHGGQVRISAVVADTNVEFQVEDNGPGVAAERMERLFEPYNSGNRGGMGLGLAICRTIIEAHGGRMWHEPVPCGGASFRFTLPIIDKDAVHD